MNKGIRNADAFVRKLGPASTRATHHKLKVDSKKRRKKKKEWKGRKQKL